MKKPWGNWEREKKLAFAELDEMAKQFNLEQERKAKNLRKVAERIRKWEQKRGGE